MALSVSPVSRNFVPSANARFGSVNCDSSVAEAEFSFVSFGALRVQPAETSTTENPKTSSRLRIEKFYGSSGRKNKRTSGQKMNVQVKDRLTAVGICVYDN